MTTADERPDPAPRKYAPFDTKAARATQLALRDKVERTDRFGPLQMIGGADVGLDLKRGLARAVIVLLDWPDLTPRHIVRVELPLTVPYIPGFLSFRELPALEAAFARLPLRPDLLFVDGHGIAHPRRFGIASHLGVLLDLPTIGVAKSRLAGAHLPLDEALGASVPLVDGDERLGHVLRAKARANPLYISPGHRVGIDTALALVRHALDGYRLPRPTRLADRYSKAGTVLPDWS